MRSCRSSFVVTPPSGTSSACGLMAKRLISRPWSTALTSHTMRHSGKPSTSQVVSVICFVS